MKRYLGVGLLVLTGAACVTRPQHESTQAELRAARSAYARLQEEADGTANDVTKLERELQGARQSVVDLQKELEATRARADAHAVELAESLADRSALEASIEKMKVALAQAAARELAASARAAELHALEARLKALVDAGKLRIHLRDGRMVLELPTDILFASASSELSAEGRAALLELGAALAEIDRKFQVEGHTDDRPIRTSQFPSNWELGAGRALVVVHTLVAAGVEPTKLSAASFGEYEPAAENETDAGRRLNRRIELVMVPDLSLVL